MVRRVFRVIKALSDDDRHLRPDGEDDAAGASRPVLTDGQADRLAGCQAAGLEDRIPCQPRASVVSLVTPSIGYGMDAAAATNRPSHG